MNIAAFLPGVKRLERKARSMSTARFFFERKFLTNGKEQSQNLLRLKMQMAALQ
jgi:hypothetical protein